MILAVGGPSHSGKTSFIKSLQEVYGDFIIFNDEIIRKITDKPIDELRKDANEYFKLQKQIIGAKIKQEVEWSKKEHSDKLVIFDRTLADSLYYYFYYVDKSTLTPTNRSDYESFLLQLIKFSYNAFENIYDKVAIFEPIPIVEDDPMRPKNLSEIQQSEYFMIKLFVEHFTSKFTWKKFDFNVKQENNINEFIKALQYK